jgi:hypothetical protein
MEQVKQTAVELLIEQIKSKADSLPYNTKENRIAKGIYVDCLMMAKQAKEMEKEKIKKVWDDGVISATYGKPITFEQYYNDTYGGNNHLCCTPIGQIKRYVNCIGCDRKPLTYGDNK